MARKKRLVVLTKLAQVSRDELTAMNSALSGAKSEMKAVEPKRVRWTRRFAASGKASF